MLRLALILLLTFTLPARAQPPRVVTDIPVVHSLVAAVMDGVGTPELLLDRASDAHGYQMRPSQARALARADLIIWIGPRLTPWLDRAIGSLAANAIDLKLLNASGLQLRQLTDQAGPDPHAWLNPDNARLWLDLIADRLARLDPDNGATYRNNAANAQSRIATLSNDISEILGRAVFNSYITYHDSFGYFGDRFLVDIVGSIRPADASPPGAARLTRLREMIRANLVSCVFSDLQSNPALVNSLLAGTDIATGTLDVLGASLPPGPDLYTNLMRNIATEFANCTK